MRDKVIVTLSSLAIVAIILAIVFNIPLYAQTLENEQYIYVSKAVGISMEPTLYTGDLLVVETKNATDFSIQPGDIIIFTYEGKLVGHRFLYERNGVYYTKGDNAGSVIGIDEKQIVGKVIGVISRYNPVGQLFWEWRYG